MKQNNMLEKRDEKQSKIITVVTISKNHLLIGTTIY